MTYSYQLQNFKAFSIFFFQKYKTLIRTVINVHQERIVACNPLCYATESHSYLNHPSHFTLATNLTIL